MTDDKDTDTGQPESIKETTNNSKRDELKTKLLNPGHWLRLVIMILMFIVLFYAVKFILSIALIVQWVITLLMGEPNERLKEFTKGMNRYGFQIMEYISFNSDERPFPLSDWPETDPK